MSAGQVTPIADYAFIGDTRTGALVSNAGAIDWLCAPHFDSPPIFGALVAGPSGGTFRLSPVDRFETVGREYVADGTALATTWRTEGSQIVVRDALVANVTGQLLPSTVLVRRVQAQGRPVDIAVLLDPVRDGSQRPRHSRMCGVDLFAWGDLAVAVCTDRELTSLGTGSVVVSVEAARPLTIVVTVAHRQPGFFLPPRPALEAVASDQRWWADLACRVDYDGPWRAAVIRSTITLKLLTFSPSGAPVAAPTSSLPEELGAAKNWDYRYAWLRDAGLGVATFLDLSLDSEAKQFFYWMLHATRLTRPRLSPALTLFGNPISGERLLDWPGYADSRPVRLGNVVTGQRQLDVYGFVFEAADRLTARGYDIFGETWRALRGAADHVAATWREPDAGIWEIRGKPRQWVHSKMFAWLALDRAQRIGRQRGERAARLSKWEKAKEEIHAAVIQQGYDQERWTFVREFGRRELDGALLLLPTIGMEPLHSPRVIGTVDAVRRDLHAGGPYFYRHDDRGEGAFLPVSFWMAQALASIGRVDEASAIIDQLVASSLPLGLFSEEADPATRQSLGNYPQALTHAALIGAVLAVRDATR